MDGCINIAFHDFEYFNINILLQIVNKHINN